MHQKLLSLLQSPTLVTTLLFSYGHPSGCAVHQSGFDLHFPSLVAQMVKNLSTMRETGVPSLGQEDPLEKGLVSHFSILAWRIP